MKINNKLKWTFIAVGTVLLSPFLFIGLLMAHNMVLALLSPTLNSVRYQPDSALLAGTYFCTNCSSKNAVIILRADHSMEVDAIPAFDPWGKKLQCIWDGSGSWSFDSQNRLQLKIVARPTDLSVSICTGDWMDGEFDVLGQKSPFRLYTYIGDPDEGQGLNFQRR